MSNLKSILSRIDGMSVGKRGERVAPHKPLFFLQCLGALQKGLPRFRLFVDVREELGAALRLFSNAKHVHPEYPFWRLQNDSLAEFVADGDMVVRRSNTDPTVSSLIQQNARSGLLLSDYEFLTKNPRGQGLVINYVLDRYFSPRIHEDISSFFGLRVDRRDVDVFEAEDFRCRVLDAYKQRCALSGFSILFERHVIGVDAVRIIWPWTEDTRAVNNGIAMTTTYAKMFDLGVITIDGDYKVQVSSRVQDNSLGAGLTAVSGRPLTLPAEKMLRPNLDFLAWHQKWIFKE
jgi:putative restriction endonuclease